MCGCLHLSMLVPHQVVGHKSMLSKVTTHLILRQHPSVLTPIARALQSRWSLAKASIRKFFATLNHSTECAPLSLNPSYIVCRSSAIFNTIELLPGVQSEGVLAQWMAKEFQVYKHIKPASGTTAELCVPM
jgi:hypothetical protein